MVIQFNKPQESQLNLVNTAGLSHAIEIPTSHLELQAHLKRDGSLYMSSILSCKVTLYTGKNEKGADHKAPWAARTSLKGICKSFLPAASPSCRLNETAHGLY
jgi:hypothetical protein